MNKVYLIFFLFVFSLCGTAQKEENKDGLASDSIYTVVEQMPSFPGGETELMKYVSANLKYPTEICEENGLKTRVSVRFVVDVDGSIKNVEVIRSICPAFDSIAVQLIKDMPQWTAGRQNGKPVPVYFTLPVHIHIRERREPVKVEASSDTIFAIAEQMPQFVGGEAEMLRYISKNLKYPAEKNEKGFGRVVVRFVVGSNGVVRDVELTRSSGSTIVDNVCLKLVERMPKWKAGRQFGKAVPVYFTLPIYFHPK